MPKIRPPSPCRYMRDVPQEMREGREMIVSTCWNKIKGEMDKSEMCEQDKFNIKSGAYALAHAMAVCLLRHSTKGHNTDEMIAAIMAETDDFLKNQIQEAIFIDQLENTDFDREQ